MPTLVDEEPRLLGAWHRGHRTDLESHLSFHGELPVPLQVDLRWAARLAALLEQSGLTGRGGAAFPTASKFNRLSSSGGTGSLVVNAMEGEPASLKDRVLMSYAPHLVLDGAQIVAAGLGASRVVVCLPEERHDIARSLGTALAERTGTTLARVPVQIAPIPGGYLAGEESALVSRLNGARGVPSFRADKSIPLAIGRQSTLVHNAETLANVAMIARRGPDWFRERGDKDAPGTYLVTVSGAVEHAGVYEVSGRTPVRQIVERAMPSSHVIAVLAGGYGGAWLTESQLDVPYSPAELKRLGASIGPGVLVAIDETVCGIAETTRVARYMATQNAGQCGPCVFGLPAIADDITQVARGTATDPAVLERLRARLEMVDGRGACRHPDGVVRMVRSALLVFSEHIASHLSAGPCAQATRPTVFTFPEAPRVGGPSR